MESVNKKIILIAILLAGLSTFLVYNYIKNSTYKPEETVESTNVYVAAKTIMPRHKIEEVDIKLVPTDHVSPYLVKDKNDIIGKYAKESIIEGEQILKDRLVNEDNFTLIYSIPEGKRAVSISVTDESTAENLIRPGDFVDVIGIFDAEEILKQTEIKSYPKTTKTVLQNSQVLAVGSQMRITEDLTESPRTVTLALDLNETEKIFYLSNFAQFRLVLRGPNDEKIESTKGTIREDFPTEKGVVRAPIK